MDVVINIVGTKIEVKFLRNEFYFCVIEEKLSLSGMLSRIKGKLLNDLEQLLCNDLELIRYFIKNEKKLSPGDNNNLFVDGTLEKLHDITDDVRTKIAIEGLIKKRNDIENKFIVFKFRGEKPKENNTIKHWESFAKEVYGKLEEIKKNDDIKKLRFGFIKIDSTTNSGFYDFLMDLIATQFQNGHPLLNPKNRFKEGPILLEGETGTGKTQLVKLFNQKNNYVNSVSVNLASISQSIFESRLKGYKAGAFTGADSKGKKGWFESSDSSTLFLDEFQSSNLESQVALLDLINAVSNTVSVARVGDDENKSTFKTQLIAAINEPIGRLVESGRLRADLFHRFRSIYKLIPLRELFSLKNGTSHLLSHLIFCRWKSARVFDLDGISIDSKLIFEINDNVLSILIAQEWKGNFREFEKSCFDLFFNLDFKNGNIICTRDMPESILHLHHDLEGSSNLDEIAHILDSILQDNEYIIQRCCKDPRAKKLKISSPKSLKASIIDHYHILSDSTKAQKNITRIIDNK